MSIINSMNASEIRQKFLKFFEERGHRVVPSSSLIPDDPSVLLTTAGMQQFKKYYTGEADPIKDFGAKNTVSIQKSFRTSDIDEVGDESHLTSFEMLGNFSFGGYFKEEAIRYAYDFITKEMGLEISYVTVFKGLGISGVVPKDEESKKIWKSLGVSDIREEEMEDVFWGPTGSEGPCGSTTEIYCKNSEGKDIEIWNIVFNEFYCHGSRDQLLNAPESIKLSDLPFKGIDTGMGLERLAMISQKTKTIFETDLFSGLCSALPRELLDSQKRVIVDHLRASVFLLADGVRPSNKERGYILRRLMRRILTHEELHPLNPKLFETIIVRVINDYGSFYPELLREKEKILGEYQGEHEKFGKSFRTGFKEFDTLAQSEKSISGKNAFHLYQSFGFPREVMRDLARERGIPFDDAGFESEFKKHQEVSRAGSETKFGGHGLYLKTGEVTIRDETEIEKVTRLHTATHLMHAALRAVLGTEVRQDGSDITVERTRFDFRFPRKVTSEELAKIEEWVNDAIQKDLAVKWEELGYEEALKHGALGFFREKYPPRVKVYTVFDSKSGKVLSKEFCGGPHVEHTGIIGRFRITKEESSSAGVRRIRAVIEPR